MAEKQTNTKSPEVNFDQEFDDSGQQLAEALRSSLEKTKEEEKEHASEKLKAAKEIERVIEKAEKKIKKTEVRDKKPPVTKGIKAEQYKATMRRVEAKLPTYQKVFSKVINNKAVDAVSAVAGRTIARPSGLMGGSVMAFVGLLLIYTNAKTIGFEYNSGSAIIFFISFGWLAGLLIEYLWGAIKKLLDRS